MHLLSSVLHISKNHMLVLQCESGRPPKEKASIFSKTEEKIGVISEIFGPVKKPYITVKPVKGIELEKLVGEDLYIRGKNE